MALLRAVDLVEADTLRVVIVQDFGGVVVENTNDGAGEVGGTVRGIHLCFEIGLCGSGETDEREHEGDGESERHRQPRREAQCRRGRITPKRRGHCEMLVLIGGVCRSRVTQPGAYGVFGFHSRASFCASAIWAGVICLARSLRYPVAISYPFPAARLYHMWALTKSWGLPSP